MPMAAAVAGIQARGSPSRRRATSHCPVPMTAPAIRPPTSAATPSLIRPTAAWAAIPAIGKLMKPAVHSSQLLTLKRRGSPLACPGMGRAVVPARSPVALVSVVMGCPQLVFGWYPVLEFSFRNSVDGGPVCAVYGPDGERVEMRCSAPGHGRGRPGRGCRAQQDGDAQGSHPESPAGAADQAGQVPDREAGNGGGQNVALVEQVERADGEPGDA